MSQEQRRQEPLSVIARHPDVCWGSVIRDGSHHAVLWSPLERRVHLLNSTAAAIWDRVESAIHIDALIDQVHALFDVDRSLVDQEVTFLIERLVSAHLLREDHVLNLSGDHVVNLRSADSEPGTIHLHSVGPQTIGPLGVLGCAMLIETDDANLFAALSSILDPLRDEAIDLASSEVITITANSEASTSPAATSLANRGWAIGRDGVVRRHALTQEQALRAVLAEVNGAPLDVQRNSVVLHAAGAALVGHGTNGEDKLVIFPGVSNAGKSTLVTQLCIQGHGYLTDEAVAIDVGSLAAQPFHKAICVEPSAQHVLADQVSAVCQPLLSTTWDLDPRHVGGGRLASGGSIGELVFPKYIPGSATQQTELEPFETLQRLIANAFDFGNVGQPAFAALVELANTIPSYSLEHGGDGWKALLPDRSAINGLA